MFNWKIIDDWTISLDTLKCFPIFEQILIALQKNKPTGQTRYWINENALDFDLVSISNQIDAVISMNIALTDV